jgi:hypothetical protein
MRSWDEGSTVMIPETMIMPDSTATSPLHAWQSPSVACLSPACRLPVACLIYHEIAVGIDVLGLDLLSSKWTAMERSWAQTRPSLSSCQRVTIVIDEKLSVLGDDGELHTVVEDISVTEVDE